MSRFMILFAFMTFSFNIFACECVALHTTKSYLGNEETFTGRKVTYQCKYECSSGSFSETITGTHVKKIRGKEKGNEIICEGTVYVSTYSTATNWFYWNYKESKDFNPKNSPTSELKEWSERHCQ